MKKQLSIALASAISFGTLVPAFANETTTSLSDTVDVRLANGKEVYSKDGKTVFKRYEIFNYNGASADETKKHTLKSEYKDLEVLVQKDAKDRNEDLFVLSKKSENSVAVATNKAKFDAIKSQIKALVEDGYEMTRKTTQATITDKEYVSGEETVTLTKGNDTKTILFTNVDSLNYLTEDKVESLRKEVFGSIIKEISKLSNSNSVKYEDNKITVNFIKEKSSGEEAYRIANLLKYTIENNKDKFDIVIDESGANNTGKLVKLYVKDSVKEDKNTVMNIEFDNIKNIDETKIVDMPIVKDSDFNGHWAQEEIVDAMINGYVDASSEFRPKDSVTRAEFSKMVCTIFGIDTENLQGKTEPFHDVNSEAWYYKYITALYNEGGKGVIINGYTDSTFRPNDTITRQEAAKMIAQAIVIKGGKLDLREVADENGKVSLVTTTSTTKEVESTIVVNGEVIDLDSKTSFKDDAEIKAWADASVENLKQKGIVNGYEGNTFKPQNEITRVEALLMLTRGQDLLK